MGKYAKEKTGERAGAKPGVNGEVGTGPKEVDAVNSGEEEVEEEIEVAEEEIGEIGEVVEAGKTGGPDKRELRTSSRQLSISTFRGIISSLSGF